MGPGPPLVTLPPLSLPGSCGEDGDEDQVVRGLGCCVEPARYELERRDDDVVDWAVPLHPAMREEPREEPYPARVDGDVDKDVDEGAPVEDLFLGASRLFMLACTHETQN